MLKRFYFFAVLFFAVSFSFSQSRGYLGLFGGVAIPQVDFGSKDPNSAAAGYARTGFLIDASYAKTFRKTFIGFCADYRYQQNTLDNIEIENYLIKKYGNVWTVTATPWKSSMFLLGAYFRLHSEQWEKVTIDIKLQSGFNNVTSPQMTIIETGQNVSGYATQSRSTARAVVFGGAIGVKMDVSEALCLILQADYLQARPVFDDVQVTSGNTGMRTGFTQPVQNLSLSLGVGIKFE